MLFKLWEEIINLLLKTFLLRRSYNHDDEITTF